MKLILLGPPGAGKGTIAKALMKQDGSVQISTGDILRAEISAGSKLGQMAEAAMSAGNLVSDDIIMGIIEKRLTQDDCQDGFLFDGFPRTIPQAEALTVLLGKMNIELDCVLLLDIDKDVIVDRLTTRRTCTYCGEIYNVKSKPPKVEGICDVCGHNEIVQRDDETIEAIENRLRVYDEQTAPLVDYYEKKGNLVRSPSSDLDKVLAVLGS